LNILLIGNLCIFCLIFVQFISTTEGKVFAYVTQERRLWWSMVVNHFMIYRPPVTHTKC